MIANLGETLRTLELSGNTIESGIFEKFQNFGYLNLSSTNLTEFNSTKLQSLKILNNTLTHVNLTTLNSRNLEWLNSNGNFLNNFEIVNETQFPKLSTLGIPKDKLNEFMKSWKNRNISDPNAQRIQLIRKQTNNVLVIVFIVIFCIAAVMVALSSRVLQKIWQKSRKENATSTDEHSQLADSARYERGFDVESVELTTKNRFSTL